MEKNLLSAMDAYRDVASRADELRQAFKALRSLGEAVAATANGTELDRLLDKAIKAKMTELEQLTNRSEDLRGGVKSLEADVRAAETRARSLIEDAKAEAKTIKEGALAEAKTMMTVKREEAAEVERKAKVGAEQILAEAQEEKATLQSQADNLAGEIEIKQQKLDDLNTELAAIRARF